jgi:MoaA/NifB/PqqE/SkfB family radical SAM enzyme
MSDEDWLRVIEQAASEECRSIQFIGGEPMIHPSLRDFIVHAKKWGFEFIEIFTNANTISDERLALFNGLDVHFATSFYSTIPEIHDRVTQNAGSFNRTVNGITKIVKHQFPLRACLVELDENRAHIEQARAFLRDLGVKTIQTDHVRKIGRAAIKGSDTQGTEELCGACWKNKMCVTTSGVVYPCVMSRHYTVGSVLESSIGEIIASESLINARKELFDFFAPVQGMQAYCNPHCNPNNDCSPQWGCNPDTCNPIAYPCMPNPPIQDIESTFLNN